jgi:hypothetical protein
MVEISTYKSFTCSNPIPGKQCFRHRRDFKEILKRFSGYDLMRPLRPAPEAEWPIGPGGRRPKAGIGYRHRLGLPISADLRIDSVSLYIEGVSLSLHPVTRESSILSIQLLEYAALHPYILPDTRIHRQPPLYDCQPIHRLDPHRLRDLCWQYLALTLWLYPPPYHLGVCHRGYGA